ncbi:MAG: cytochrome c biogenesis protein ResB, partial [Microbacteriaceae bacterium]|nr:cytochrome c biogenesis protein ResB [Microbacteriaceae bacterium]
TERVRRRRGYRVARFTDGRGRESVSAERGYLRETGNLVFHVALIGVLAAVAVGGSVAYTGQRVIAEGYAFTNVKSGYDSFHPGRVYSDDMLAPFSLRLDQLLVDFEAENITTLGTPKNFRAQMTITEPGQAPRQAELSVNGPLEVDGVRVYLLGNGYAPVLTVRDPEGNVVFSQPTLFRPMDAMLTSVGVVKIPDGLAEQVGIEGLFAPAAVFTTDGRMVSAHGDLVNPVLQLELYTGDLGLDDGRATNAYVLDAEGLGLTKLAGRDAPQRALQLGLGDVVDLPDGLGTIEFTAAPRFTALQMHYDPAQPWLFGFVLAAVAGLLLSLFVPRRRVWARAAAGSGGAVTLEWAGLARGEDPRIEAAVAELADAV